LKNYSCCVSYKDSSIKMQRAEEDTNRISQCVIYQIRVNTRHCFAFLVALIYRIERYRKSPNKITQTPTHLEYHTVGLIFAFKIPIYAPLFHCLPIFVFQSIHPRLFDPFHSNQPLPLNSVSNLKHMWLKFLPITSCQHPPIAPPP
jgi:hypothetical protein